MSEVSSSDRRTFDEFCEELAAALGVTTDLIKNSLSLVADLHLDELSMVTLVLTIQAMNPFFEIPDQMDVDDLSVTDLYHYYDVIGESHIDT